MRKQWHGLISKNEDYYAFGLTFNSYQRENSVKNNYLYNVGSELQDDLDLGVYETDYRMLDPSNGRWWQVDPMVDNMYGWSPYNYSFNNPIRYNDPKGDCPPRTDCGDCWLGLGSALLMICLLV
jgi:RHS repeat-associated protein